MYWVARMAGLLSHAFVAVGYASTAATHAVPNAISTPKILNLQMLNVPPTTRPEPLFNGRDLSGWDSWLGSRYRQDRNPPDPRLPLGLNKDRTGNFRVVREDGAPAIRISGELWGGLLTRKIYKNYHLRLQYKWGEDFSAGLPRNNGVLYHSHGRYGDYFGTFMPGIELEIMPGLLGAAIGVGPSRQDSDHSFADVDWLDLNARVKRDSTGTATMRYTPVGRLTAIKYPDFAVHPATNVERPVGQWNTVDIYVVGNSSVHVVNGVPVVAVQDVFTKNARGQRVALTQGRIQLQSEGAETYFRNITIEQIDHLPEIRLAP